MKGPHQSFPADWLDEAVDDFCNEFGTDFGAADNSGVTVHAGFPVAALLGHCGDWVGSAEVGFVLQGTDGDVLHYVCSEGLRNLLERGK